MDDDYKAAPKLRRITTPRAWKEQKGSGLSEQEVSSKATMRMFCLQLGTCVKNTLLIVFLIYLWIKAAGERDMQLGLLHRQIKLN